MCGIAGFLGPPGQAEGLAACAAAMAATVAHRGPDGEAVWTDPENGLAFGHRRLCVVDVSPLGDQPMDSPSGRYVITYNGEIYDHADLRAELEAAGVRFRGHSDTEVLLAGFDTWGIRATLRQADGMFAFAVWDREQRVLTLVRDRLGERPLYWSWTGRSLLFGSELKALRAHPDFRGGIDPDVVALYLRFGYVPGPYSIHPGTSKLPPGSLLEVRPGRPPGDPEPWWELRPLALGGRQDLDDDEALARLDDALRRSVALRLTADVPVGAFLSGGVDSSLVCAVAQDVSATPVRTFTVGFDFAAYDESHHAADVASRLGTDHTEVVLSGVDALEVVPRLPQLYDEPFADSSQIPAHLVSVVARRSVTVALSGDGGDELFAGYARSLVPARLWPLLRPVPVGVRRTVGRTLERVDEGAWDRVAASRFVPGLLRQSRTGAKIAKLARTLGAADLPDLYRRTVEIGHDPRALLRVRGEAPALLLMPQMWPAVGDTTELALYLETMTYLPDDILVKVDRAGLAVGLETRLPLLAPDVVELAWSLPLRAKVRNGSQKWILRRLLDRYLPAAPVDRPKMGFGVPIGAWLRGPLRPWAEDLLDDREIEAEGILDPGSVRHLWDAHLSGKGADEHLVWAVLMLRAWSREWA